MSTDHFKDREKAFEAKYHMDQEIQFKVMARRDKLFGLWAAEQMGLAGGGAETYARSVVDSDLEEPTDDDVIRKVLTDLDEHEVDMTEGRLRIKLEKFGEEARKQIMGELGEGKQRLSSEP